MAGFFRSAALAACLAVVFSLTKFSGLPSVAMAESKAENQQAAAELVDDALECELTGQDAKREELLKSALEKVPDYPPAMWQSGHVQLHNKWVSFDEVPERTENNRVLKSYHRMREQAPQTVDGQMALAEWCAEQKLPLRTRAHLSQVIELDPDNQMARRLLGYQRISGQWLDAAEINEMRAESVRLNAALAKWRPKLAELLSELNAKQQSRRDRAREALGKIDAPDAVPAIELILARHSKEMAELAVELLDHIDTVEAVEALTRLAIYSPWESVQQGAVYRLKPRDPAAYAPMLIALLEAPIISRAEFTRDVNGQFVYRHLIYREGQEEIETALHQTNYPLALLGLQPRGQASRNRFSPNRIPSQSERRQMLDAARLRDASSKAAAVESRVALENMTSQQRNSRVCAVLKEATGVDLPANAEDWWQWWTDYNGKYDTGEKLVRQRRTYDTVQYRDPYRYVRESTPEPRRAPRPSGGSSTAKRPRPRNAECLQAGTLVCTESGYVPIEQVKVGDLVLSQHLETGQLDYKPVLNTTVRPPTGVIHIRVGGEVLCSSGGHPFWVAGQGWQFARDITAPMVLHTVTGTAAVDTAEPFGVDEFYNIDVADFHTFFVTKSNILTHDLTTREATDYAVPGLVKK